MSDYRRGSSFSQGFGLTCGCLTAVTMFVLAPIVVLIAFMVIGPRAADHYRQEAKPDDRPTTHKEKPRPAAESTKQR